MFKIDYSSKNFLIIDNVKPSLDILKKFAIGLSPKSVDSTKYPQDVVSLCLEKRYDIILLGYNLGEKQKNGQQILEELRVSGLISRHCVVIIITAEVSQAMVLAALEHKPDSYLCKPYSLNILQNRLDKCMVKKISMYAIYQALDDNDKKLAIDLIHSAIVDNTSYKLECLGIQSRQFFELKQFDQAEAIYLTYKNKSGCQWANVGLGKIALQNSELGQAESIFKDVISQYPLYLPAYDWLSVVYGLEFNPVLAQETLEQAIELSPRSVHRLKKYAELCFDNKNFEKSASAYQHVYELGYNSIHHSPQNALSFVKSLISYSKGLSILEAKKMNNRAFTILAQMNNSFKQKSLKIQSYLLSGLLLENIEDYSLADIEVNQGLKLLTKEQKNMDSEELADIAFSLNNLKKKQQISELLNSVNKQKDIQAKIKLNQLSVKDHILSDSYTFRAQKALIEAKELYEKEKYQQANESLTEALNLFPNHEGIKLNLVQVLLKSYEHDRFMIKELKQAKEIILELITIDKDLSLIHI